MFATRVKDRGAPPVGGPTTRSVICTVPMRSLAVYVVALYLTVMITDEEKQINILSAVFL